MIRLIGLSALVVALAVSAQAQPAPVDLKTALAGTWRAAAQADVEAAYDLVRDNHPAEVPAAGDAAFRATLETAHDLARTRAAQVDSYESYSATLAGLANALGDKHIWSRPNLVPSRPAWAGLLVSKRGEDWVVTDEDAAGAESLLGARLVACDGRPVEDLARERLGGFRVDWSVGAQQIQAAPWLLVDERNPFAPRPKACAFDKGGALKEVTLAWRMIKRDQLTPRITRAMGTGQAGFGLRRTGAGYWISLQNLDDPAAPIVAQVEAQAQALRAAPFVVLDLRGNGGGSSTFGRRIAVALMSQAHVEGLLGPEADSCGGVWRVSDGNVKQIEFYRDKLAPTRGPEFARLIEHDLAQAKAAQAAGQAFSASLECKSAADAARPAPPPSLMKGRLVLLTDSLCFSSCLIVADEFRKLGALHVGQTTDAATRYSEVREEQMPSGLSYFSTLQALSPGAPIRYGPFAPSRPYPGDIADTTAVEAWIRTQLAHP